MVKIKLNPEKVVTLKLETAKIALPPQRAIIVRQHKLRGGKRYKVRLQLYTPSTAFERFRKFGKYEIIVYDVWEGRDVYHAWGNNRGHMLDKVLDYYKKTKCDISYGANCEPED